MNGATDLGKCSGFLPTDKDIIEAEQLLVQENPVFLVEKEFLFIKTKDGQLVKLVLNSTQKKLLKKINELRKANKPIRIWVLKYRQGGISTFIEAIIYALTSQQANRNALIMADEKDKSDYLFQMSKLYHDELNRTDPHLTPTLKKSNAKVLEFDAIHSQIIIETAENLDAARAYTYQYCHLSECSRFRDLKTVMGGLMQSVPMLPGTMVIGETTANGMNAFYDEWQRAKEGKSDWVPMFFPWFEMEEYKLPLQDGKLYPIDGINFGSDVTQQTFEQQEQALKNEFGLSDEQLNWRRWAIVNNCNGDIALFDQEYPATDDVAFRTSGDMFFDRQGLDKQVAKRPLAIGEIFFQNLKWEWRDMPHGRIEIFERPFENEQYLIISDASEAVGADEASILVLNKRTNTTAAIVAGQHTPEELAQLDIALGNFYNKGMIVPENKGYGYMVCQLVFQNYGNVYRKIVNKDGIDTLTDELGFNTNAVTRPQMLAQMNEEIKHNSTFLNSSKLISQCRTFVIKKDKDGKVSKIEAQAGYQDGLVICRAIGSIVRNQYPYKQSFSSSNTRSAQRAHELKQPAFKF